MIEKLSGGISGGRGGIRGVGGSIHHKLHFEDEGEGIQGNNGRGSGIEDKLSERDLMINLNFLNMDSENEMG